MTNLKNTLNNLWRFLQHFLPYWPASRWARRVVTVIIIFTLAAVSTMYGIAQWYIHGVSKTPQVIGASFIPDYAQSLGLDPHQTLDAMLHQLHIKHIRLVSYWSDMEPVDGVFNFSQLDQEFAQANQAGAKVTLSIGLRQPRWPECHAPNWVVTSKPTKDWQPLLQQFMMKVVDHYKNNPALQSYQVENEYFLKGFGTCNNFDRSRLVSEFDMVRHLDPTHTIIVNRSNNGLGIAVGKPTPEEYGVSIYKRVWDGTLTHRYLEYPQPAWYYAFMAGVQKIAQGKPMIAHEMQAEAWAPAGKQLTDVSLHEQNKSLDAERLQGRFQFARDTGLRTVDMWGAEYWYYRQQILHDPSLWNVAKSYYDR